jgi:DNA-binding response OmpR family regulator
MGSILVADDEPVVRDVLSRYLTREGYTVSEAADGEEALSAIRSDPPQAVVLDLMLPRLSGLDVLKLVRLESDLPVIILSAAHPRRSASTACRSATIIVKPT